MPIDQMTSTELSRVGRPLGNTIPRMLRCFVTLDPVQRPLEWSIAFLKGSGFRKQVAEAGQKHSRTRLHKTFENYVGWNSIVLESRKLVW